MGIRQPKTGDRALEPQRRPAASPGGDSVDAALASAGDASAFERLYRRHSSRIFGLAVRMVGHQEAEEVTQEVFVRAWTKLESFRGEAAFGTWLYRMGINTILSHRAKVGRYRDRHQEDAEDEILERAPARPMGRDGAMDLEKAMRTLPDGARDVFVLHDVEGFKHEEIAKLLAINVGTSKSQLHRARMLLRRVLGS